MGVVKCSNMCQGTRLESHQVTHPDIGRQTSIGAGQPAQPANLPQPASLQLAESLECTELGRYLTHKREFAEAFLPSSLSKGKFQHASGAKKHELWCNRDIKRNFCQHHPSTNSTQHEYELPSSRDRPHWGKEKQ